MIPWPVHRVFHLLRTAEPPTPNAGAAQENHYYANQRPPNNCHINAKIMRWRLIFLSYINSFLFLAQVKICVSVDEPRGGEEE